MDFKLELERSSSYMTSTQLQQRSQCARATIINAE